MSLALLLEVLMHPRENDACTADMSKIVRFDLSVRYVTNMKESIALPLFLVPKDICQSFGTLFPIVVS